MKKINFFHISPVNDVCRQTYCWQKKGANLNECSIDLFLCVISDIQNAAKWHATNVSFKGKKSTLTLVMAQTIFVMEQRHGLTS